MGAGSDNVEAGIASEDAPENFRLSASASHLLRRAQQYASEVFARAGMADGVTLRQTIVLAAIAEEQGRSQSELVRATGVDRSTLADMISRMEKRGLIAREVAARDGRAKAVSLTDLGVRTLTEALPTLREVDAALLEALPKNRRRSFREMLGFLAEAADEVAAETVVEEARPARRRAPAEETSALEEPAPPKNARRAVNEDDAKPSKASKAAGAKADADKPDKKKKGKKKKGKKK